MVSISLARWASQQDIPRHTAYRMFHSGRLVDRYGNKVQATQEPTGAIMVHLDSPADPLANVSADAIVKKLHEAGYVVLTREQAGGLGLALSPHDAT